MIITLNFPDEVPTSEFSKEFLQYMLNRMAMSYFKYGLVANGYPRLVDAIGSLKYRLDEYEKTGNTENLADISNFAMIEFMKPRHPDAHFKSTDKSLGRKWIGEVDPLIDRNKL